MASILVLGWRDQGLIYAGWPPVGATWPLKVENVARMVDFYRSSEGTFGSFPVSKGL